ncbi:spore germination protein [Sporomusa aerivorans]|uniref:spore germination protein n=1 Tax=Sporomusa aerivorans TaxID=204936 RepID=UPI00352B091B
MESGNRDKTKQKNIHKLSALLPDASLERTRQNLKDLKAMVEESARLGEKINQLVADIRQAAAPDGQPFIFTNSLDENKQLLKVVFRDCEDIKMRSFSLYGKPVLLVYLDGMADTIMLGESIMKTFAEESSAQSASSLASIVNLQTLINEQLSVADVTIVSNAATAIESVMAGKALLLLDGPPEVLVIGAVKHVKRSVQKGAEDVIRGPHDAFNETLNDNIVLIRRRSKDYNVKVRILQVGLRTKTSVAVVYVADLVKPGLVEEVERRLAKVKVDRVLASKMIEEQIVEHPWTPFPQLQETERPDKTVAAIYEGQVAIIVDNTPATMLVPCTYNLIMQTPEDYTTPPLIASLIRFSRHISAFIAIYLPAIYVAVVSYHPGLIPTTMAISIAELRSRTPFPSFLEAFAMEILLELFQEAIIRMPQKVAGAAAVVGALVIGTTVVQAGLVNPFLVVVTAMTAIASYNMPSWGFGLALRFFRIPLLILASILGLYGVMIGLLAITVHLCSIKNFGQSYLGGMFNFTLLEDWADQLVRLPQRWLGARPKELGSQDRDRQGETFEQT